MYNWLNEDVLGTFETGSPVARFIFDNNYFSETSLGHIFKTEVEHIHIERVDILDAEGNPAADFISLEYVAKLKQRGYRSFMREYMNTPIEEGSIFKADWIQYGKPPRLRDFEYLLYYNDPSFKSSKASDFKAIVLMGKIGRKYWILRAFCRQCSINNMVDWHYEQAKEMEDKGISCLHYCEANMLQDIVLESYDAKGEATGWYMSILPDTERKPNKLQRIEESSAKWESRDVFIDEKLRDDPDFKVGLAQILAFEKGSRAHDDFPDACEGAMHKLSRKARSFSGTNEDTKPRLGKSNHPKYRY
jgi:phage terminase large subunit-like protein